jgi:hypothetical protein
MLENPKLTTIEVDGVLYSYMFWDFSLYTRMDVYKDGTRIGMKKLPIAVDKTDEVVIYSIRRMVGNYGPARKTISTEETFYRGGKQRRL